MSSNVQVLMHQGELQLIARIIKEVGNGAARGCLFGLWRNSLKQPVVQFVTGPGRGIAHHSHTFTDNSYDDHCKEFMEEKHRLLKLGYWYSGTVDDYPDVLASLEKPSCDLLLFIKYDGHSVSGTFFMKKDNEDSKGLLYKEDILSGDSSFRLHRPLTNEINNDAMYKFGSNELDLSTLVGQMPTRTEVRDPETKTEQWYSSEKGVNLLQTMFQSLQSVPYEVEMSRDANTHNLQFNLNRDYCLDFPLDFPRSKPQLTDQRRGKQWKLHLNTNSVDDICRSLVGALQDVFSQQRERAAQY